MESRRRKLSVQTTAGELPTVLSNPTDSTLRGIFVWQCTRRCFFLIEFMYRCDASVQVIATTTMDGGVVVATTTSQEPLILMYAVADSIVCVNTRDCVP